MHQGQITEVGGSESDPGKIVGMPINIATRIMDLGLGRQILMTRSIFDDARHFVRSHPEAKNAPDCSEIEWKAHGRYSFKGVEEPMEVFEVGIVGWAPLTTPENSEKTKRLVLDHEETTLGWRPAVGLGIPGRSNWLLNKQLGEGGFGEVWLAVHKKTHTKRVFKFCFEADRVRGLRREVVLFRLLKETLGPRDDITQILDWEFDHPPYFLEAEYTEGGDLLDWSRDNGGLQNVTSESRLEIVAQTAVALAAAHSVGVLLHKDIKPSNILMTEQSTTGQPRASLTDFGIGLITDSKILAEKGITATGLTQTMGTTSKSSGSGTRLYMAPELIEGKPATTLSDIYALGVVLYQIVIGDFHRAIAPGWERDINDELLRGDIAACVDGLPERRLASATELAVRLRNLSQRHSDREAEQKIKSEAEIARRRRRQYMVCSAIGLVLLVGVGIIAFRESNLRRVAEHARYVSQIRLAAANLAQADQQPARTALPSIPPMYRDWEWGYLVGKAWPHAFDRKTWALLNRNADSSVSK